MNMNDTGAAIEAPENIEKPASAQEILPPCGDLESDTEERALALAERNQKASVIGRTSPFSEEAPELDSVTLFARPTARPTARAIRNDSDTEYLLNGLIAECHLLMRSVALPTAMRAADADTRNQFLGTAINLATVGAKVGRAVAKLRGAGTVNEFRQRHVTEHVLTTPAPQNEKELRT